MKDIFKHLIVGFAVLYGTNVQAQFSKAKRRADSFFGVHFDFHAQANDNTIGQTLTPEMVNQFLTQVKPDYIQVDTKGHPGISSYPTRIGTPASRIVKDPLTIFREATAKKGVGLYAHFSGVMDINAVKTHPEWARVNADRKLDGSATSLFGDYASKLFIPQIKELSSRYHIDGVWVDGDCWAVQPDFSPAAIRAYKSATGRQANLDREYMDFTRKSFNSYLANYTAILHKSNPNLQIASNWAFSSYMPGKVDAGVDFLSGDVVNDDIKNVDFEARTMADEGKPWDLMIWGFTGDKNGQGHFWKSAQMLKQKVSDIISQGGGYSIYINQNRDASIPLSTIPTLKEVAEFANSRKAYSFKTTPIPQIAVLFSGSGHDYDLSVNTAFNQSNGGNDNIKGTLSMLLNSQYSVQVLQEVNLAKSLSKFPLLVITEWNYMSPEVIKQVESYVYNGGKVLIIGGVSCGMFNSMFSSSTIRSGNNTANLPVQRARYGKGEAIGVNANISLNYLNSSNEGLRETIASQVKQLFPNPKVLVTGSKKVHVTLNKKGNSTLIHLVNTDDRFIILNNNQLKFELAPSEEISVTYYTVKKASKILLQPGNISRPYNYSSGKVRFTIPRVDIYSIVEII